jgi:nucleoid DNA-binding protein
MNRNDLVIAVAKTMGLKIKDADRAVVNTLHQVLLSLGRHESVTLMGFGTFRIRKKNPRLARNPRTGERVEVCEKFGIIFRPSKLMKQFINASPKVKSSTLTLAKPPEIVKSGKKEEPNGKNEKLGRNGKNGKAGGNGKNGKNGRRR